MIALSFLFCFLQLEVQTSFLKRIQAIVKVIEDMGSHFVLQPSRFLAQTILRQL